MPSAFDPLIQRIEPGGRLSYSRRLRGGMDTRTDLVCIQRRDSGMRRVVVKRGFSTGHRESWPERMTREYGTLGLLANEGIPASKPLFLDVDGECFGVPTIVLSYVPGRTIHRPRDAATWAADLATAASRIHRVPPERLAEAGLASLGKEESRRELVERRKQIEAGDQLAWEALRILEESIDCIVWLPPCLTHDDFWAGNTVWYRGRLAAVIDWADAKLGDPRSDLSECYLEVYFTNSPSIAEAFLAAYEKQNAGPVPDFWFFKLFRGLRGLLYHREWLVGYRDAGLDLDPAEVERSLRDLMTRALDEAGRAAGRSGSE